MNKEEKKRYQYYIELAESDLKRVKGQDKTLESYFKKKIAHYKNKLKE